MLFGSDLPMGAPYRNPVTNAMTGLDEHPIWEWCHIHNSKADYVVRDVADRGPAVLSGSRNGRAVSP